ncbi:hypothetical protein Trydic_g2728 [Trypoxylus dichotomus]
MRRVGSGKKGWTTKVVQLMTGHGCFKAYHKRFGLSECGKGQETAEHAAATGIGSMLAIQKIQELVVMARRRDEVEGKKFSNYWELPGPV